MKLLFVYLLACAGAFAQALDFTYKGVAYENRSPSQQQITDSPGWRYEDGEPPLKVTEAHALALAWIKKNLGEDFSGTAHSAVLNYQPGPEVHHGYWTIVFTEEAESKKKWSTMTRAEKLEGITPAHLQVYVLFDRSIVGPRRKNGQPATSTNNPTGHDPRGGTAHARQVGADH